MNKSESIVNLAKALCSFQGEVTNPKNCANNPFFKSTYAPLNEVINTVKPLLAKNGLSVLQSPSGDGENIIITTLLMHSSGEWIEGEPLVLRADKVTAQGAGSAITYGRRYSLSSILGISSEDDDDGNHATGNGEPPKDKTKKTESKKATEEEILNHTQPFKCSDCGVEIPSAVKVFSEKVYHKALCMKCQTKAKKAQSSYGKEVEGMHPEQMFTSQEERGFPPDDLS